MSDTFDDPNLTPQGPTLRGQHPQPTRPVLDRDRVPPDPFKTRVNPFASMEEARRPAPSTTSTPDQDAMLAKAFPSMVESSAPERSAAPAAPTSTPPTSDTPPTETAASRVEPAATTTTVPTDTGEPTTLRLEDVGEIALPPGFAIDTAALEEFTSIAAEHHFDGATAQKMIDLHSAVHSQAMERAVSAAETEITESWSRVTRGWADTVRADKEIGGAGFKENLALARSVLDQHPGFKAAVKSLGIGNHPELIRFLCRVGRTGPASASTRADDAAARSAFPSMK